MTSYLKLLDNDQNGSDNINPEIANGDIVLTPNTTGSMDILLKHPSGQSSTMTLPNVLYAPGLRKTLISVIDVTADSTKLVLSGNKFRLLNNGVP